MENQEEKETSLEYYHDKVLDFIIINDIQGGFLIDSFYKAKKMYTEEIAKAFEKGFEEGVKYTDGLIRSDERFRF